jgi:hypothetical protein
MWRCRPTICRTSETAPERRFDQLGLFLAGVTNLISRFVIIPTCFAALATGLLQTLGTPWGLFRY